MGIKVIRSESWTYKKLYEFFPEVKSPETEGYLLSILSTSEDLQSMGIIAESIFMPGGPVSWHYDYDEIVYVTEGPMIVTCEGKKITCNKGDICIFTKGTDATFEVPFASSNFSITSPPLDVLMKK